MENSKIEIIKEVPQCALGESPHWCSEEKVLYFVDILKSRVLRYDPVSRICNFVTVNGDSPVSFVVPVKGQKGKFVIGRCREICQLTWDVTQTPKSDGQMPLHRIEVLAKVDEKYDVNQLNNGKCDPKGRLWAGTIHMTGGDPNIERKKGRLYKITPSIDNQDKLKAEEILDGINLSNGMEWSQNNKTFYYVDSAAGAIFGYDFDNQNGTIKNKRTIFDFKSNELKGFPDGLTICDKGHLWVACFGGSQLLTIDPKNGKILNSFKFEGVEKITCVAFGGPELDDVYVTSGYFKEETDGTKNGGQLFVIKNSGAKGFPGRNFTA